jgi:hypothetical protein
MTMKSVPPLNVLVREQAAKALLKATYDFLRRNKITEGSHRRANLSKRNESKHLTLYRKAMRTYENMGVLMATWFTDPRFLDSFGNPMMLTASKGPRSITNLIRLSKVRISTDIAIELLKNSPSVKSDGNGCFVALRRVFVLPEFEIPRAALVVERFLDTLRRNALGRKRGAVLLLERSCHVPEIDLRTVSPILRDIKERGTAFMDSTDGEIEANRLRSSRRSKRAVSGQIGVVVFAWTRSKSKARPA